MIPRRLALALLAACGGTAPQPGPADRLPWLVGTWVDPDGDTTVVERWVATPDGDLLGSGYVRIGPQVLGFAESLAITRDPAGGLHWTAWPVGQPPATFRVTLEGDIGVALQRDGDAFPNRIRYTRNGDTLDVVASGLSGAQPREERWQLTRAPEEPGG